ncbi:MAG: alpha/beta hydrolase [Dorea sp.]|nr:alpha/beta hydrolase [Dorea sp.]
MIIKEQNFMEQMEQIVEPYLAKRRKESFLDRDSERNIFCAFYQADEPDGIVLISHGFTETADKYHELAYYFLKAGFHVCVPEHLGHGRSSRLVEDPSLVHVEDYHTYVEDLLAAASEVKSFYPGLPLYLFGHSMGGGIAACAAAGAPDTFAKLILSSPMIRPQTGRLPWTAVKAIIPFKLKARKGRNYLSGHRPYDHSESFEESGASSKPRFDYYQKKRQCEPLFQMNGATNQWLSEAIHMEHYLLSEGWKQIQIPILLFQAENDTFVCPSPQEQFARQIHRQTPGLIRLVRVPDTKHEIYNSTDDILTPYIAKILAFLQ